MFSSLSSKVFGATSVGLALLLVFVTLSKNAQIDDLKETVEKHEKTLKIQREDLATLAANELTLKGALKQCSESVARTAQVAASVARSGQAAVEQVRAATEKSTAQAISRLQNMPRDAKAPLDLCAQADAILQQGAAQ